MNKKKKLSSFVFYLIMFISLNAQDPIDSSQLKLAKQLVQKADEIYDIDQDSAINLIVQANTYFEKSKSWEDYIANLNTLSTLIFYENDIDLFKEYSTFAVDQSEKKLPLNHAHYAKSLNNLNSYYYRLGNFEKSVELLKKSLEIKINNGANPENLSFAYNNIGTCLADKGDNTEALIYLVKSLEMRKELFEFKPEEYIGKLLLETRNNIASTYLQNNQYELALSHYEFILDESKRMNRVSSLSFDPYIIAALQSIANIYLLNKKYEAALSKVDEVLSYQVDDKAYRKSYSFELLGDIAFSRRNYEEALFQYEAALSITRKYYAKSLPDYSRKLIRIATVQMELRNFDESLTYYQNALEILAPDFSSDKISSNPLPHSLFSKPLALEALRGKGIVFWEKYLLSKKEMDLTNSYSSFLSGIEVIKAIREGVVTKEAKNTLAEKTILIYEGAIRAAIESYSSFKDEKLLLEAFALAESNKSMLLLESLKEQTALGLKGLPDSLTEKDKV